MIVSVTSNSKFQSLKSTSGQPFDFADKATALLSCYLLSGVNWPGKRFGKIISLHCEVSQDGWRFDDVLVTFTSDEGQKRLAISLKSNCQFTQQSARKDFTTAASRHSDWPESTGARVDGKTQKSTRPLATTKLPADDN